MTRWIMVGLAVVGLVAMVPGDVVAQQAPRGFEAWVGYAQWGGSDAESLDPGVHAGLAFLTDYGANLGLGGEVVYGKFEQAGQSVTELGLYVVGRYSLRSRASTHAFVQGRVGWNQISVGGLEQSGFSVGPDVGIEVPLTPTVRVSAAVGGTYNAYGNVTLGQGTLGVAGTSGNAFLYGARIGVSVGQIF